MKAHKTTTRLNYCHFKSYLKLMSSLGHLVAHTLVGTWSFGDYINLHGEVLDSCHPTGLGRGSIPCQNTQAKASLIQCQSSQDDQQNVHGL